MIDPPRWSEDELRVATRRAAEDLRATRISEPLERYLAVLDDRRAARERRPRG